MKIMVNEEVRDLRAVDKRGIDWTADLLGNHDALHLDPETDEYIMTEDEFDWWEPVVDMLNQIEELEDELFEDMSEDDKTEYDAIAGFYTDLDQETAARLEFLKNYKDNAEENEEEKKEYAVNTRRASDKDEYWSETDQADWFDTWDEAFEAAEQAFEDPEVEETKITIFVDGDAEDFPLYIIREDGSINQYQNGKRLWL